MNTPPFLSPTGQRFSFMNPRTPRTTSRSPLLSPTRIRPMDDLLADLSPATTFEAFTSNSGTLKKSIEAATPAERAFGIRAAHASQKIEEWVNELSEWSWPEGGSTGFELPISKRRSVSRENEENSELTTEGSLSTPRMEDPVQTEEEYWGSMPVEDVLRYESRIDEITEDMEDLEVEDIKRQVLNTHIQPRSRPSSSHDTQPVPSIQSYQKMDDFTAVVTATVLQALPNLARLMGLMDVWSVRIVVLRNVQPVLSALEEIETAMKSAWNAVEKPNGQKITTSGVTDQNNLPRETFNTIRNVLQSKVGKMGRQLDSLLDTLEGREDTVPDSWLDRMEVIEEDYSNWIVYGNQKVLEGEWEAQKKRLAAEKPVPVPVLNDLKIKGEQEQNNKTQDPELPGDTVQLKTTTQPNEDKPPTLMSALPSAMTDVSNDTIVDKNTNTTVSKSIQPATDCITKAAPTAPFVLKRNPQGTETQFDSEDQVDLPDTPSRIPRGQAMRDLTAKTSIPSIKFPPSESNQNTKAVGLEILRDSPRSHGSSFDLISNSDDLEDGTTSQDDVNSHSIIRPESLEHDLPAIKPVSTPSVFANGVSGENEVPVDDRATSLVEKCETDESVAKQAATMAAGNDILPDSSIHKKSRSLTGSTQERDVFSENDLQKLTHAESALDTKQSIESLRSQFDVVSELPTPPEVESTQVDISTISARLPATIPTDSSNISDRIENHKETPPSSTTSSISNDMNSLDAQNVASEAPTASIRTPPLSGFGVERASTPRTPSSAGSANSRAIRSPSNQSGNYKKDKYLEDGGTPRSPTKRRLRVQGLVSKFESSSYEKAIPPQPPITSVSSPQTTSPKPQSQVRVSLQTRNSEPLVIPTQRILVPIEAQPGEDTGLQSQLQTPKPTKIQPSDASDYVTSESGPELLDEESAGCFTPVLSPIRSPRDFGGFDGATPTKHTSIPLDDLPGFADLDTRAPPTEKSPPKSMDLTDEAPVALSSVKRERPTALELSNADDDSGLEDTEELPDGDMRRASAFPIGKLSRASLKTVSRPSSSGSGPPITPEKQKLEDAFATPSREKSLDPPKNMPLSAISHTPSVVTTDTSDLDISPLSKQSKIHHYVVANTPPTLPLSFSSTQQPPELVERSSTVHLKTPSGHTPRNRSVSMITPKSSEMLGSHRMDPGTPPSGSTPKEPPHLKNVAVMSTPVLSPSKTSHDQFHQQITQVLQNIPAQIKLATQPNSAKSELHVVKKRPSVMSLTDGRRPLTRPSSPSFTLAPAQNRRPRPSNGAPEIKLYHLSRSTGEAPIKLFVRLVGEHGERVMVRVGGGWADLGEYLKEYASHHRRADRESKVEVQDLSPRSASNSSSPATNGRSSPYQRPATSTGRPASRMASRPPSSLERPMSTLAHRRSRLSLGEGQRDSPFTPSTRRHDTSSVGSGSRPSSRASMNWTDDDGSLGLAGPKSKRVDITEEDEKWIESMKEKVRQASLEKEGFGDIGKAGGTKRLFRKGV